VAERSIPEKPFFGYNTPQAPPTIRMEAAPAIDLAYASSLIEAISFDDHLPTDRTVLVFRTSVADRACMERLGPLLDRLVGRTGRWTFDLEDRDRVLRIETDGTNATEVIRLLRERGEQCSELE
jgi:hypothetical protein